MRPALYTIKTQLILGPHLRPREDNASYTEVLTVTAGRELTSRVSGELLPSLALTPTPRLWG